MEALANRLVKNQKKLAPWAKRIPTDAWRLYDRDIPEFPLLIDVYADHFLIHDRSDQLLDAGKDLIAWATSALIEKLGADPAKIVLKRRERQSGLQQYEKLGETESFFTVREGPAKFRVNLRDYLDTGLFLDHRPMRHRIFKEASSRPRALNLFCYTGSVSVMAALGGARVESVDMSATYLDWARENFRLNGIETDRHEFVREDVLEYLRSPVRPGAKFDLIFLDPPTFSNSKKMEQYFEVEKDQEFLVEACLRRLAPGGVLYFSNNKRSFRLSEKIANSHTVKDISDATIPPDFHDRKIHRCYQIS